MIRPTSLYVHVPFCRSKCAYCDFFSLPLGDVAESFVGKLVDSILARAESLGERFGASGYDTVYVGGGTPSSLPPRQFERLLSGLASLAPRAREWTVEANPESLDPGRLDSMLCAGVTRLSLGIQSLDDGILRSLGRPHDAGRAEAAMTLAASVGLELSADLMAALPRVARDAPPRDLASEAARLVELGARHLSIYDLVVEEGTPIAAGLADGGLLSLGEDEAWEEREAAEARLASSGFRRYEVSNYSVPGAECRHNLAYWRMDSYLGAGPGAVSTVGGFEGGSSIRIEESRDLARYPESSGELAVETAIGPREAAFESIMMGFRTRFGFDAEAFRRRFGLGLESLAPRSLARWGGHLGPGWAGEGSLALDERGLDLLNRFLADCLAEMDAGDADTKAGERAAARSD